MENMDWKNLGFGYYKTDFNIRSCYRDGKWGALEMTADEYIPMHMAATCLHYGQEAFEGLKAYRGADGRVRLFRAEENARRLVSSARCLCMAEPPVELFMEAAERVVKANARFIPPYGTGASLYLRPLLIGLGAQVGVKPAKEFLFMIFVTPVGPYFKEGFNPIRVIVERNHDRAAPKGTGHVKVGGNYAASIYSGEKAHHAGYANCLYVDAAERKYIEECGAANFFAIRGDRYITPDSHSVLPSITNMSLRQLAEDFGLKVERRAVELSELSTFDEVGACGTAAVISPIREVYDPDTDVRYTYGEQAGPWSVKLYEHLRGIQLGTEPDPHGWCKIIEVE